MYERLKSRALALLKWSEKYTKTDMVYLAQAGFWTNLNFVIVSILGLGLSIAFANLLPREVYGTYQYLIALSGLFAAVTLTGMNTAVTQSVARGFEGDLRAGVRAQLRWSAVPAAIGLGGALYYCLLGNGMLALGLVSIALLAPLTNAFNTYGAFLNGKREFKRIFTYGTSVNLLYYAAIFLCVFFWKDAIALVFVNLASNALGILFFYFRTLRTYQPTDKTDPHTIPYGMHLSVMNAFGAVVTQLDSVLVFHFLGAAELAVYSFASLLPERVSGLFKFVSAAALPKFSGQTREQIRRTIVSKMIRAGLVGAAVALAYAAAAPFIFHLLFPKYVEAIPYTILYSLTIVTFAAGIPGTALYALRMRRELYAFNIANAVILLGLQVPLLIFFGIAGILIARVAANAISIALALLLLFRPFTKDAAA